MIDSKPKQYSVTIIETIAHTRTFTASNERAAIAMARVHRYKTGTDGFHTRRLGSTDVFIADQVQP